MEALNTINKYCKNVSETFPKIRGNKRNHVLISYSLNTEDILVKCVSKVIKYFSNLFLKGYCIFLSFV